MDYLKEFKIMYNKYKEFNTSKIPLCAAETYVSDFVKQGLTSLYEGMYIQGYKDRDISKDNIGSDYLYELMLFTERLCDTMFKAKYTDARCLSGMSCFMVLMTIMLDKLKDKSVLITTSEMGGHPSFVNILNTYGIPYKSISYDFATRQVDYDRLNSLINSTSNLGMIIFCQSDVLNPPDLSKIVLPKEVCLLYDATQTLGLIAAGLLDNPLTYGDNVLLIGGTHKTLPATTGGIIMSNNKDYMKMIDHKLAPELLRNIQINRIASLALALIEQLEMGKSYQKQIVQNANLLGKYLSDKGLNVIKVNKDTYTNTHQLFVELPEDIIDIVYNRARKYSVTFNKRNSQLLKGIRIGVQEITRYGYSEEDIHHLADLLYLLTRDKEDSNAIFSICKLLSAKKESHYVLSDIFME